VDLLPDILPGRVTLVLVAVSLHFHELVITPEEFDKSLSRLVPVQSTNLQHPQHLDSQ